MMRCASEAKEPTEVNMICPHWNWLLIARYKGKCCANTVNRGSIREIFAQVEPEFLLNSAADADNDVL